MIENIKTVKHSTPIDDISGLMLPKNRAYTLKEIYVKEAENIAMATIKYLSHIPVKREAPFTYEWFLKLHFEMFGKVWQWAGKLRQTELSIGIRAYLIPIELKKLSDDLHYWEENKTYDIYEIATRLHHKAVKIHPFQNGNGRWGRMLANIYLRQNGLMPVKWQEELLAIENPKRNDYIKALKKADEGDFAELIKMHQNTF